MNNLYVRISTATARFPYVQLNYCYRFDQEGSTAVYRLACIGQYRELSESCSSRRNQTPSLALLAASRDVLSRPVFCSQVLGRRAFVGINFLSRVPIVTPAVLAEMFGKARMLGLASIGGNPAEMVVVPHAGCRYPGSTDRSLRKDKLSWGSGWGVNIITS